jgi:hypothetical protein
MDIRVTFRHLWRNVFVCRHLRNSLGFIHVVKEQDLTPEIFQKSIVLNGVGVSADALVGTLSGGEGQGFAISRAMHFHSKMSTIRFFNLLALGLTLRIIAGELDLSFPAIMAISGLCNGLIIVRIGVLAIIATIGTQAVGGYRVTGPGLPMTW